MKLNIIAVVLIFSVVVSYCQDTLVVDSVKSAQVAQDSSVGVVDTVSDAPVDQAVPSTVEIDTAHPVKERQPEVTVGEGYLGSDFNLGRLPAGSLYDNVVEWALLGDEGFLLETIHCRSGKTGYFSSGYTPILTLMGTGSGMTYFQMLPEFDFSWRTKNSHTLSLTSYPFNIFFVSAGSQSATGFDMPFTMLEKFRWEFLSKQGKIRISPDQYDLTFLLGSQLNPGQFRNSVDVAHTINADTFPLRLFHVALNPSVGVIEGVEIDGAFRYSFQDSVTSVTYRSSGIGDKPIAYNKLKDDSLYAGIGVNFRRSRFFVEAGYGKGWSHSRYCPVVYVVYTNGTFGGYDEPFREKNLSVEEGRITLLGGYLYGNRIRSINEVQGNWDGSFSRILGRNQLFATLGVNLIPNKKVTTVYSRNDYFDTVSGRYTSRDTSAIHSSSLFQASQHIRYGIFDFLEIGEQFNVLTNTGELPSYQLGLRLAVNTIPMRTYGPEQATHDEYFNGIWLKKSQVHGSVDYYLPFFKKKLDYEYLPIYERVNTVGPVNGMTGVQGGQRATSVFDGFTQNRSSRLDDADLSINVSWGVTDKISISNRFDLSIHRYKPSYVIGDYFGYTKKTNAEVNTIVSQLTTFSFRIDQSIRFTVAGNFVGQSDHNEYYSRAGDAEAWTVLVLIQGAIGENSKKTVE